jgi:hypothetical protein
MILSSNLPRVCEMAARAERVLDVGGWWCPFNLATHVLDVMPYATRRRHEALDLDHPERFAAETWTRHDACRAPWPFPDKFFDFSFCSHTLEDVRDPLTICSELMRVSKAGYLETPSRAREIFCKKRWFGLRSLVGCMPEVGFAHHRWFVELEGDLLRFTVKDQNLLMSRHNFITREQLGRKMTEKESGLGLFWNDSFRCEEAILEESGQLRVFRDQALKRLRHAS